MFSCKISTHGMNSHLVSLIRYGVNETANHHPQHIDNQSVYDWQRHAHTVPQTNRGGRRLPQTPNVPSTLTKTNQPQFGPIDPRHDVK